MTLPGDHGLRGRARGARAVASLVLLALGLAVGLGGTAQAQRTPRKRSIPSGSALTKLVESYLEADAEGRAAMEKEFDEGYKPLPTGYRYERLRDQILKVMAQAGPRIERSGTHFFYPERQTGKYIVEAPKGEATALFLGLHGGGVGSGDAEGMASGMGGGGFAWVFPEVLEKTERGWVDAGTEEFVLELAEAARRTFGVSADRVYVSGHSMGGHGTWSLAAHHPDVFAGGAAYAGGPSPFYESRANPVVVDLETGLLPNLYRQRFLFFQSGDDPRVPPPPNDFAAEALKGWKERYPDGFDFRYERVDGRGHAAPAEGYLPTQQWVAEHALDPWPSSFLWQPTLPWKKQFYWLIWPKPVMDCLLHVQVTRPPDSGAKDSQPQIIDLKMLDPVGRDPGHFSLLLREPLVDVAEEIVVRVDGEERFRGRVEPRFSVLMRTALRADPGTLTAVQLDL